MPRTRVWRSAWLSGLRSSRPGGWSESEALGAVWCFPPAQGLLGSLSTQAPGSPALRPGNQQAWSFIALSNHWAAGFLWVLIACLAWHRLPAWLLGILLPSSGNQTSSISWLQVCCHVSCSFGLKPALPAGWVFQSLGLVSQGPPGPFPARAWEWGAASE